MPARLSAARVTQFTPESLRSVKCRVSLTDSARLRSRIMSKKSEVAGGDAGGERQEVDTAELPHIPSASLENLQPGDTQRQRIPGSDPYNSTPTVTGAVRGPPRRGLDDMPQFSACIKAGERPAITPTSDLALRLAGMRVELERVLSDMETHRGLAVDHADRKAVGLMLQLRLSAQHLEDAIDSLLPIDKP